MCRKWQRLAQVYLLGLVCCTPANKFLNGKETEVLGNGYSLKIIDNAQVFSVVTGINSLGDVIGLREETDPKTQVGAQKGFFRKAGKEQTVPVLSGYTNTEIQALSDNGFVVGYASRPIGNPQGSITAILWDSTSGKILDLGKPAGDVGSHAQDICADGSRITGYSTGANPARMRPCVWTWNREQSSWEVAVLPTLFEYNPFLMVSNVLISPNGKLIAACIVSQQLPSGGFEYELHIWEQNQDQEWVNRKVCDKEFRLKDLNNQGMITGAVNPTTANSIGKRPCWIDAQGNLHLIKLLPGDVSGEALGIDESGLIVGFSDDAHGPEGGPQAFVYRDGKTTPLSLPVGTQFSSALAINARGQIGGMLDVTFPAANNSANDDPIIKTLGFVWTPQPPTSANTKAK